MSRTAVIAGVGPGLGESLARTFAAEGCDLGLLARTGDYVGELASDLEDEGVDAVGVQTDVAVADDVDHAFERVHEVLGPVDVLVNHASHAAWTGLLDQSPEEFEDAWRVSALGGFHCCQQAVPDMLDSDGGTVVFTGATSGVRGRGGALGFSSAKFAVRGMAESLARELGPEGVHVAHVVIDGQILTPDADTRGRDESEFLDPDAIAESYWHLVEQDRSAWTLELDLRPHVEAF